MRNIILLLFLFIGLKAAAQESMVKVGAGYGVSNVLFKDNFFTDGVIHRYNNAKRLNIGLEYSQALKGNWYLSAEIGYSGKGGKYHFSTSRGDSTYTTYIEEKLHYVQIAPGVQYRLKPWLFLGANAYAGYMYRGTAFVTSTFKVGDKEISSTNTKSDRLRTGVYNQMDYGTTFTLGISFKEQVDLRLSYSHSIFPSNGPKSGWHSFNRSIYGSIYLTLFPLSHTLISNF